MCSEICIKIGCSCSLSIVVGCNFVIRLKSPKGSMLTYIVHSVVMVLCKLLECWEMLS